MNISHSQKKKIIAGSVIAAGVSIVVILALFSGLLDRLENMTYDYRMKQHRKDVVMHEDIELVLIDDASLQAMTPVYGRYPWPRSAYGELLDFFPWVVPGLLFSIFYLQKARRKSSIRNIRKAICV